METKRLVIGVDFGSSDSYVAYVDKGTIDIVQNEVSQRRTPSLVGFTDKERLLGDTALSQIKSNVKNTCRNFKHLLGQKPDSPLVAAEQFWSTSKLVEDADGMAGCGVTYKGESVVFSAVDITAMFFTKLKDITESWCQGTVADVVVGVPSYFSDFQRQAVLDAGQIAGLNILRVMNEHTATALEYGYFRTNNFDLDKPQTVAFCQMGHVSFSVAIVQFVRGRLSVLCERSDKVGGRDMDECLIRIFAEQFKKKTGCDVLANKKALFKLEDAVTKTKKILSANSESSISCECLMEDEDFGSSITRADFEDMCKPMMKKVSDVLEAAKAACGLAVTSIDAVEICGGASRVPWFKEMCSKAFGGKELSTTMNADECVARGCALQAAILSKLYKVREFKVEDTSAFPVSIGWTSLPPPPPAEGAEAPPPAGERSAVLFPQNSLMNLKKVMTFFRKESFELRAQYADEKGQFSGVGPKSLGSYTIEVPEQSEERKVKVKAALTLHGTFTIQGAQLLEEEFEEEEAPPAPEPEAKPEAKPEASGAEKEEGEGGEKGEKAEKAEGAAAAEAPAGEEKKRPSPERRGKKKVRRTDLSVKPAMGCPGLSALEVEKRRGHEEKMIAEMRDIEETNARKNDLESYILTMRSGVAEGGKYAAYVKSEERDQFSGQLEKAEDWLYDHMDDAKQVYEEKMRELRLLGDPIERRFQEEGKRPDLISALEEAAKTQKAAAQKPKNRTLDKERLKSLEKACDEALQWLDEMKQKQAAAPKNEDPVLDCASLETRTEELTRLADAVFDARQDSTADLGAMAGASPVAEDDDRGLQRTESEGFAARPAAMDVD